MLQLPPLHPTYIQTCPPPNSTLHTNKHPQLSVTLCQPWPALFPGFFGLQCPHCERAAATACWWTTVKYYPDDIDIVQFHSLSLFLSSKSNCRRETITVWWAEVPADCQWTTDLRTPQESCPTAADKHKTWSVCCQRETTLMNLLIETFLLTLPKGWLQKYYKQNLTDNCVCLGSDTNNIIFKLNNFTFQKWKSEATFI